MATLKEKFDSEVSPALKEALGKTNVLSLPRLAKIVVNMGLGVIDKDVLKKHVEDLGVITGQRPVVTTAKKSIANFKVREGMSIGARVTLRGERMYEFLDRLINAALPRIRDFRGLSRDSFDRRGNYSVGIKDQTIFPEIDPNEVTVAQGMDITIVTTTESDDEARELLSRLGMPFVAG